MIRFLHTGFHLSPLQSLCVGEDSLSVVRLSACTARLPATAECAGARYHVKDGHYLGMVIFCPLITRLACVPCVNKNGVQDFEVT